MNTDLARSIKLFLKAFLIHVYLITSISAQSTEQKPEDVVNSYWFAMRANDWAKCAHLVHPRSLSKIRNRANSLARALLDLNGGSNLHAYFGVRTKEEYERLSDIEVFERLMRHMPPPINLEEILNATTYEILDTTKERDDLVHILYRVDIKIVGSEGKRLRVVKIERRSELIGVHYNVELPAPDEDRAEVISVKKDGSSWKILLAHDVIESIDFIEKQVVEFKENMRKFAEELSKQQNKRRSKSKPAVPRR